MGEGGVGVELGGRPGLLLLLLLRLRGGVRGAHDELRGARRREGHRLGRDGLAGERGLARARDVHHGSDARGALRLDHSGHYASTARRGTCVDGCGNSRAARWAEPLTKSRSAGASKPSGAIFLSPHWRMGARSDSLCARSLPGFFQNRLENGPSRRQTAPAKHRFFSVSAAGSFVANQNFASSEFREAEPCDDGKLTRRMRRRGSRSPRGRRHRLRAMPSGAAAAAVRVRPRRRARGVTRVGSFRARHRASRPVEAAARGRATAETRARRRASRRPVFRSGDRGRGPRALPLARAGGRARAARDKTTGT